LNTRENRKTEKKIKKMVGDSNVRWVEFGNWFKLCNLEEESLFPVAVLSPGRSNL